MSDLEQQSEEIEALSSIFPSEFKLLDDAEKEEYFQKFSHWQKDKITNIVTVELQPQEPDAEGKIHVIAILVAAMVQDYPTSSPILFEIESKKGLSPDQIEEGKATCTTIAEENVGMPIIFMLTSSIQEWLQENNIPGHDGSMYADMMRRMQKNDMQEKKAVEKAALKAAADNESKPQQVDLEELERIRKRQAGEAVTLETFLKWKKAFDEEMAAKQASKELSADEQKPTGKQFFFGFFGDSADLEKLLLEAEQEEITEDQIKLELEKNNGEEEEDEDDEEDYIDDEEEYDEEVDDDDES